MISAKARWGAAFVALAAWTGLTVQFVILYRVNGSAATTVVGLLAYFTIITNLLVAIVFSLLAVGVLLSDWERLVAATTLSIVLVGVVYALLLSKLYHLSGWDAFANFLLHQLTPILVPLFWLSFAPKGKLSPRDPALWAIYPLVYFAYALTRGDLTGVYPYPFMDAAKLGWAQVGTNAVAIAAGYLIAGEAMVLLDRGLARPRRTDDRSTG